MIRYTTLDPSFRRDLPHTHQFNLYGIDGVTYPFQLSYSSFLCSALDNCQRQKEKDFKREKCTKFIRDGDLPYTAWNLDVSDALEVFLMRRLHRIAGDVVILKLKTSQTHIVLYGEAMKGNLNEGIADFVVEGRDIKAELQEIIDAWQVYVDNIIPDATEDNRFAPIKFIESQLKKTDPIPLVTTYLYPIDRGENNMWRDLEYYNHELNLMGLQAYEKPVQELGNNGTQLNISP
jgi:hypothetical protein